MKPKPISREVVAQNKWTTITNDVVEMPNGKQRDYLVVERPACVMILPLMDMGGVLHTHLVKQYRVPIEREVWQFPMGTLEEGVDPAEHAREEFREECGATAEMVTKLAEFYVDPGLSRQICHVFVAEGVSEDGEQDLDEAEQGMEVRRVTLDELRAMLDGGDLNDGWAYLGLYFLEKYLAERGKGAR